MCLFCREYIHRVGRTARAGGQGHALLFIREEEIGFVRYLKAHKVNVEAMDITWSKVANIQPQVSQPVPTLKYYYTLQAIFLVLRGTPQPSMYIFLVYFNYTKHYITFSHTVIYLGRLRCCHARV